MKLPGTWTAGLALVGLTAKNQDHFEPRIRALASDQGGEGRIRR